MRGRAAGRVGSGGGAGSPMTMDAPESKLRDDVGARYTSGGAETQALGSGSAWAGDEGAAVAWAGATGLGVEEAASSWLLAQPADRATAMRAAWPEREVMRIGKEYKKRLTLARRE